MKLKSRSLEPEIMDDLQISGEVVNQTLKELDFINRWLGGNQVTFTGITYFLNKNIEKKHWDILDIGCGSGEMLNLISRLLEKRDLEGNFIGIDANPHIVDYAKSHIADTPRAEVHTENIFGSRFRTRKTDLIICTLVLHHFTESELIDLLQNFQRQARVGIVINDLHRHPVAYYSIAWLTALFSKSAMVRNDARLSVARGFTRKEWVDILQKAGIKHYRLRWRWAFRWSLLIPSVNKNGKK